MQAIEIILGILILITSILVVVLVLLQEGAIAGGAETFFGKSKGRTMEQKLVKITRVLAIVFFVLTLGTTLLLLFLR